MCCFVPFFSFLLYCSCCVLPSFFILHESYLVNKQEISILFFHFFIYPFISSPHHQSKSYIKNKNLIHPKMIDIQASSFQKVKGIPFLLAILFALVIRTTEGQTWTFTQTSVPSGSWKSVAISNSGQYMYVVANSNVYQSTNYGSSWSKISQSPNAYQSVACDATCTYVTIGQNSNGLWSNSAGSFALTYQRTGTTYTVYQIAMDNSGKYVVALCSK